MPSISNEELSYILYQLGEEEKPFRAVVPPIVSTANFSFDSVMSYSQAIIDERTHSIYSRGSNPTVRLLEKKLAALQGTEDALCFSSGSGAIAAAIFSVAKSGDHIICVNSVYSWTKKLLDLMAVKSGIEITYTDPQDPDSFQKAIKSNSSVLILESPTSQTFQVQDIFSLTKWAHENKLTVICDGSYGTPLNRKFVDAGIDLICHTATKFIGGHSDVIAGVVCGTEARIRKMFYESYMTWGATLSADNAWLLIRSLRTLPQRIQQTAQNAQEVFGFLSSDSRVRSIIWPCHPSHPQHELYAHQCEVTTALFAFELNTDDIKQAEHFCDALKVIRIAASWGGFESLIMPAAAFSETTLSVGHVRLAVGLEHPQMLIDDLKQALSHAF
jgi:cystathionine beta-lyase/cystathionine gamma-synthase